MEHRPNPDALLEAIPKEDAKAQHGRLKIFFGMAMGAGKTYAMLQAAQEGRAEGVEVVVGYRRSALVFIRVRSWIEVSAMNPIRSCT